VILVTDNFNLVQQIEHRINGLQQLLQRLPFFFSGLGVIDGMLSDLAPLENTLVELLKYILAFLVVV